MTSKRERRREQLIQLGVELFANKPYDEVVIEDLAAAAEISKGLLYHYFGSKKAFYLACIGTVTTRLVAELTSIDAADPSQGVRVGLDRFFDFMERHGKVYRSLMVGASGGDLGVHALFDQTREAVAILILGELGVPPTHPMYRNTVRAWLGAVEAAALDWINVEAPDRSMLVAMQARALADRLLFVDEQDPGVASERAMASVRAAR